MSNVEQAESGFTKFKGMRRKPLKLTQEGLVSRGQLEGCGPLPLVLEATGGDVGLSGWAESNLGMIQDELSKHGAILFRGFGVNTAEKLEQFIQTVSGDPLSYSERSSPRSQVSGNVYTSTDYPPDKSIFPHNEQSYNLNFILRIFFCCVTPAERGGETPLADCRNVYKSLDPAVRERFAERKYMYVRNFRGHVGLSWQTAFQTTDRSRVEAYCRANEIEYEWRGADWLKTRQVRPAVARHPRTGEMVWFNHMTFFHVSTLEPAVRDSMLSVFEEGDLPNNTYYGDGSPIEASVLEELRGAYLAEKRMFPWREGDVMMVDNMLVAHAREPFAGARKVIVGMAEPFSWKNITA